MLSQIDLADHRVGSQLLGRTRLEDFTLEQQVGTVGDGQRFIDVVVGDDDADILVLQRSDDALDVFDSDRIDACERFVEQDEGRVDRYGTGDFGASPLAARQLDAEALAYFLKAELFDQRFAACGLFVLFQIGHLQNGLDVILDAQTAENRGLLRQIPHTHLGPAIDGLFGEFGYLAVVVFEKDLAFVGFDQADDHIERRGLAGSVRTQKTHDLTLVHVDRNVVHHGAGFVFLDELAGVKTHFL